MICLRLFLSFVQIGLFSIGGGYAAIPLIQEQIVVRNGWLTMNEFADLVTIAEMTPGPIAVNSATFVGIRIAGLPGALLATLGCILPSLFIVSLLAFIYARYKKLTVLQSILASLRPAVVALIASAGLSILIQVIQGGGTVGENVRWTGIALFLPAFLALRKLKCNPILIMSLCGAGSLIVGLIAG